MGIGKIAVVILNWNGKRFLEQFLPSVVNAANGQYEIVIVDNGSTDDSVSFLETNFPSLRLIRFSENYGFAGGYNKALKEIQSEYYVLLNSDVEVMPGWITPMLQLLE